MYFCLQKYINRSLQIGYPTRTTRCSILAYDWSMASVMDLWRYSWKQEIQSDRYNIFISEEGEVVYRQADIPVH